MLFCFGLWPLLNLGLLVGGKYFKLCTYNFLCVVAILKYLMLQDIYCEKNSLSLATFYPGSIFFVRSGTPRLMRMVCGTLAGTLLVVFLWSR